MTNSATPIVCVLMSTYNGSTYLNEQIDSILQQDGVEVKLIVRDDGSTDGTQQLLSDYAQRGLLTWQQGENLGPARSFMRMLAEAPECQYYAFADQDDIWHCDKLQQATQRLGEAAEGPAMYHSQTLLVDSNLNPLPRQIAKDNLGTFGESLVYKFVAGCTIVMNHALRLLAERYEPQQLYMHDTWIYSLCLLVGGTVCYDPESHISYRQHEANAVGQGHSLREAKRRWHRFATGEQERYRTALELWEGYGQMATPENRQLLADFLAAKTSLGMRLRLMRDERLACAKPAVARLFRLALLFNTF